MDLLATPPLTAEFQIHPFLGDAKDTGSFLLESRGVNYLINRRTKLLLEVLQRQIPLTETRAQLAQALGEEVTAEELISAIASLPPALFSERAFQSRSSAFHFSATLLSAKFVQKMARPLATLFAAPILWLLGGLCVLAMPLLVRGFAMGSSLSLGGFGIFAIVAIALVSALWHELGHAAACWRFGQAPGRIGFGLYLIFPSLFADVTSAWKLSPRQRVLVDTGGVYFQVILLCLLAPGMAVAKSQEWIALAITYNVCLIAHNLNPLFKRDGYWLISDLAGLPNLHRCVWDQLRAIWRRERAATPRPWRKGRIARAVLPIYTLLLLGCAAVIASGVPLWYEAHLRPYPRLLGQGWQSLQTAWAASDFSQVGREASWILAVSIVPGLAATLLAVWLVRAARAFGASFRR